MRFATFLLVLAARLGDEPLVRGSRRPRREREAGRSWSGCSIGRSSGGDQRVPGRHPLVHCQRVSRPGSWPSRAATSGSPRTARTRSGMINPSPAPSPSSRSRRAGSRPERDHGRPRRQPLVHRAAANKIGRITTAGAVITEFPIPTADSEPAGDHGRARRQPLVHRGRREQDRPDHHRRHGHRVPRSRRPAASPSGSRPGPTATSGSPSSGVNQIGRITPTGTRHRVRRSRRPAAQPDGHHGRARRQPLVHRGRPANEIGRITTDRRRHRVRPADARRPARRRSPPAPTATSGSPSQAATRSAGSPPRASSPSSRSRRPPPARRDHGRPRRQPLVHRDRRRTSVGQVALAR